MFSSGCPRIPASDVSDIESLAPQLDGYGNLYTLVSQETRLLQVSPAATMSAFFGLGNRCHSVPAPVQWCDFNAFQK